MGANSEMDGKLWRLDVGMSCGVLNAAPQVSHSFTQAWMAGPALISVHGAACTRDIAWPSTGMQRSESMHCHSVQHPACDTAGR